MDFPNKAARLDYLLRKDLEEGGLGVDWENVNGRPSKLSEFDNDEGFAKTKADVGLGNVDNTSDADKPISSAIQAALDLKADRDELFSGDYDDLTNKPTSDIQLGVTAHGWGNHADAGYSKFDGNYSSLSGKPVGEAVADAEDESDVVTQFNALLASLRGAGLLEE